MVWNTLVSWVSNALEILISLLPNANASILAKISEYNDDFRLALENINWFFPVDLALIFLGMIFVIQFSIFGFRLLKYVAGILTVGVLK